MRDNCQLTDPVSPWGKYVCHQKVGARGYRESWACCNEVIKGCVQLQIHLFSANISSYKQFYVQGFVPANTEPYFPTFSLYFRIVHSWNTVMGVTSKKARWARSCFTFQFEMSHKESQRLFYLGANCFFKQHGMGMELIFTKRTQTSIYNCDCRLRTAKLYLRLFSVPIWCRLYIRAVPNECKQLIPFQFFIGF